MTTAAGSDGAGLLIRLWVEPGTPAALRARLLAFQGNEEPISFATAGEEATVLRLLVEWVHEQVRTAYDRDGDYR